MDEPNTPSLTKRPTDVYDTPPPQILDRGQAFFDQVYGKVSQRVMDHMDHSGTPDLGLMVRMVYGYILSNTNVLSQAETSFVMVASLIPQDVSPHLPDGQGCCASDTSSGQPPAQGSSSRSTQRRGNSGRGKGCKKRRY